ncbi:MAG: hypothetical protein AMXMBFR58_20330 [Phycisphaerae bacterium]
MEHGTVDGRSGHVVDRRISPEHFGAQDPLTRVIIGAAIEVHRELGPGLLESTYESCLAHELTARGLAIARQVELPVMYKGTRIDCGFRIDLLVEDSVILELKAVDELNAVHEAQMRTYLKLAAKRVGLLINFNARLLKHGLVRMVL